MFLFLKIISTILQKLPRCFSIFLGKSLGKTIPLILPYRNKIALTNIKIVFPDISTSEQLHILKRCNQHFGIVLMDILRVKSINKENIDQIITLNPESQCILNSVNGAILMTAHFGNWEFFLPALSLNNFPFTIVTKTQHNHKIQKFLNWIRNFPKIENIPKEQKNTKLFHALNNKNILGLASDQGISQFGLENLFFNKKIYTPKGAAKLHLSTNKPIIVGFCSRTKKNKYSISLNYLNTNNLSKDRDIAIKQINNAFIKQLEHQIKEKPEQYFWYHRIWAKKNYNHDLSS